MYEKDVHYFAIKVCVQAAGQLSGGIATDFWLLASKQCGSYANVTDTSPSLGNINLQLPACQ